MGREFTRKELFDLVWREPLRSMAKALQISDVRLAKICRRANIPLPGLGYWNKKAVGKARPQPSLPPRGLGQADEVTIGGRYSTYHYMSDEEVVRTPLPPPPSFTEDLAEVTVRARKMIGKVPKTKSLKEPHPLIAKLLEEDEQRRQKTLESSWHWDKPIFDSPIEQRRLRLINRLFWAFSRCECKPDVGKNGGSFSVTVGDVRVNFTLDPPGVERNNDQRPPIRLSKEHKVLQLKLSWYEPPTEIPVVWTDAANNSLEDQLTEVAVGLIVAGEWMYRYTLNHHRDWLIARKQQLAEAARKEEEERQRKAREKILKHEQSRREKLFADAAAWSKAALVRRFVQAVVDKPQLSNAATSLGEWANWALAEADRLDPLSNSTEFALAAPQTSGGEQ
jgi:hypothetical protein